MHAQKNDDDRAVYCSFPESNIEYLWGDEAPKIAILNPRPVDFRTLGFHLTFEYTEQNMFSLATEPYFRL